MGEICSFKFSIMFYKTNKPPCEEKDCMAYADSEGPDQTVHMQSDQGLHCLLTEALDKVENVAK